MKCHILHIVLPFLLVFLVFLHLFVLHYYSSSDGFLDRFCFYLERLLFFTLVVVRDFVLFFVICFCVCFSCFLVWFFVFHEESFLVCNLVKTSDKIIPEWFFLFFFGFIKAVPDKLFGLVFLVFFLVVFGVFLVCYFEYFGRLFCVFEFNFFVFCFCFWVVSLLAVIVLLVYPCYLELQFVLVFLSFFFTFF